MQDFIESILKTLTKNGFPAKRVSLPTEKMYEAADRKGLSFNLVLQQLKDSHGIDSAISPDKIIFSSLKDRSETPDQADLLRQAQDMMSQMKPEELAQLQEMFLSMTPEQKEEIFKRGKDLGLI